jgi:very-short-patch-repair endonuclease
VGRTPRIPPQLKKGPFTLAEARAAGITLDALKRKSWRRLGSELYCWSGLSPDHWQTLVAWRNRLPPHFAFAGLSAAWLYRLDVDPCHPIEVLVATTSGVRSRMNLVVHRGDLSEITTVRGLRVTTAKRTFRDLRRRLAPVEFLVLADAALRLGLGRFDADAEPAESPMETRLRWQLIQAGLPRPQVQTELRDEEGRFVGRADLYYPQARLVIEYDGANHRDRLVEDNRRQNALINAAYRVLRFTASDRAEVITSQVRKALA